MRNYLIVMVAALCLGTSVLRPVELQILIGKSSESSLKPSKSWSVII